MTTWHFNRIIPTALAVLAVAFAGCSAPAATEEPTAAAEVQTETESSSEPESTTPDLSQVTIRFGQQGSETEALWVASGVFDNVPYTVEYQTFTSPTNTLAALANGDLDIANNLATWTVTQSAAGAGESWDASTVPYQIVLMNTPTTYKEYERFSVAASAQSGIKDLKEIKGRKFGFLPGTSNHLVAANVLKSLGLTFDDVEVVTLDNTNQVLAFETGEIDVFVTPIDNITKALGEGATLLGKAGDFGVSINTGYFVHTGSLLDPAKKAALEDVVVRIIEAQNWSLLHPDEAQASIAKYRKFTADQAKSAWEYQRYLPAPPSQEIVTSEQQLVETATEYGLLDKSVDVSVLYNDVFSEAITAKLAEVDFQKNFDASYQ
jgi:sulfonate transport system substrate-binding protein